MTDLPPIPQCEGNGCAADLLAKLRASGCRAWVVYPIPQMKWLLLPETDTACAFVQHPVTMYAIRQHEIRICLLLINELRGSN